LKAGAKSFGVCLLAATACAAEDVRPWQLRLAVGAAEIHRSSSDGAGGAIQVARVSRHDVVRVAAGLGFGGADEGYAVADLGLELRLCSAGCRVAPYVGAGVGLLGESEFSGGVYRAGGGLELRVGSRNLVRVGIERGSHGGESGPHLIYVGFARRWGSR
jgi:hypothetical protein